MLGSGLVGSDEGAGAGPARRAARGGERPAGAGAAGSRRSSGPRRSPPVLLGETGRNILSPLLNTRKDASVSLLLVNVQWRIDDVNELTTSAVKSLGEGGSVDLGADRGVRRHGSSSLGLACGVRPAPRVLGRLFGQLTAAANEATANCPRTERRNASSGLAGDEVVGTA